MDVNSDDVQVSAETNLEQNIIETPCFSTQHAR
jgi:hypothetical protein